MQRLKVRLHYLTNENKETVREWLNASPRYEVTKRDAFKYIDHRYRIDEDPLENWDLIAHLWPEGNMVRCVYEEGGITDGYTDAYLCPLVEGWTKEHPTGSQETVLHIEPLDIVVSSRHWLQRVAASCV